MATDLTRTNTSRRGLLAAGAAALAAAAAASIGRIAPVSAADGDAVTVGSNFEGSTTTQIKANDANAISGVSVSARGLNGESTSGQGVHGTSSTSAGVAGVSDSSNGVHGQSTSGHGIYGQSTSGSGVEATGAVGVKAAAASTSSGYALETTSGRVLFSGISGVASIPAGQTSVTLKPTVAIGNNTMVLISPAENLGNKTIWYTKQGSNQEIILHISGTRSNDSAISYLILEHA